MGFFSLDRQSPQADDNSDGLLSELEFRALIDENAKDDISLAAFIRRRQMGWGAEAY